MSFPNLKNPKLRIVLLYGTLLVVVVLLTVLTDIFQPSQGGVVPQFIWLLIALIVMIAILMMLSKVFRMFESLEENGEKLEKVSGSLEKIRAVLTQIGQNTRISETAKSITFRDADIQALRETVFDKLQQQDFNATFEIIDEIAHSTGYKELADQLRIEANGYRGATDQERINQVIAHIDKLLDDHQWPKASAHIERLIKAEPDSEKARAMRQKLFDKKDERKRILLTAWDDAVKRQATDRSLEILRELDMYLTPNEALALQEAARDVFRTKLHNLGVEFSLAVSERQWTQAYQTGKQIIHNFPNSKMAAEIRERIDILKQKFEQQP